MPVGLRVLDALNSLVLDGHEECSITHDRGAEVVVGPAESEHRAAHNCQLSEKLAIWHHRTRARSDPIGQGCARGQRRASANPVILYRDCASLPTTSASDTTRLSAPSNTCV